MLLEGRASQGLLLFFILVKAASIFASYDPIQDGSGPTDENGFLQGRMADYESRQRAVAVEKQQRKYRIKIPKTIVKIIAVSAKLIDKQYDGVTSVFHGAMLLSKMMVHKENYHQLIGIYQESKDALRYYKSKKIFEIN